MQGELRKKKERVNIVRELFVLCYVFQPMYLKTSMKEKLASSPTLKIESCVDSSFKRSCFDDGI